MQTGDLPFYEREAFKLFEWLLDYQKLTEEIEYLEYKLEREERELRRWMSGDLSKVKLTEGSIASGLEERIAMYEYELAHKMNDQFDARKLINTFEGIDNRVLILRYVDDMKLDDIAEELGYSAGHIRRKHAELVRTVKFLQKYHKCYHT